MYLGDSESVGEDVDNRIVRFAPSGSLLGSSRLPGQVVARGIAVDSAGAVYVIRNGGIEKYEASEPQATLLSAFAAGSNTSSLSINASNHVFAAQAEGSNWVITEYDASGTALSRFGYGEIEFRLNGLAIAAASDGVYGSEEYVNSPTLGNKVLFLPFPPPGPISCCAVAGPVSNTKATLKGRINPEGKITTYHFEYVDQVGFQANGFTGAETSAETPIGEDVSVHEVSAAIGCPVPTVPPQAVCLTPETKYHYRLVATNSDAPEGIVSEEGTFITRAPLEVLETFATEVGTDSAQLHAIVNPLGIPATGYFEFIDDAGFNVSGFDGAIQVPDVGGGSGPIDLGFEEAGKAVSVQLASLALDTTYHYRFIASDPFTPSPGIAGAEPTFHTSPVPISRPDPCPNASFRTSASANLPDCRAYEMVSPVQKGNTDIAVRVNAQNFPAGFEQSASNGSGFAYSSEKSFSGAASAPYTSQYVATRGGAGWMSAPISPPRGPKSLSELINIKYDVQYKVFTPDLSSGWFLHDTDPVLDECAVTGYPNLYRRDGGGGYEALSTAKPTNQVATQYWPELQGVSVDGTHAVFRANGKLTGKAANIGGYQLYEHVAGEECGELRLVSVLPNGNASTSASSAGTSQVTGGETREQTVANAVSEDGSRIFWTATAKDAGPLYVRIDGKETVQVSAGPANFWTAAADGSKAIYTVGENLFEFDVASKTQTLIAGNSPGLAAASKDASRLYFVSRQALDGEGNAGEPNLYLREAGATVFIATLAAADLSRAFPYAGLAVINPSPIGRGTRASGDGGELAFVSTASLTGYDNRDAEDGQASVELFVYEAESGKLVCVSCNPSGERPAGRQVEGSNEKVQRVAAQMAPWANELYAPHSLSNDGKRLFFDSFEALVPRDTNGQEDVYEWKRAGSAKECEEVGAELFVAGAEGCLSLISSGQSPSDSEMVDATPNGSDVFIKTASSLLPQDPGLIDIYDARVNGGFASEPLPPPACEGEGCQAPPAPPVDQTPASAVFRGAGNFKPGRGKPACRKGKVHRKGRCVAQKNHRKASTSRRVGR